MMEQHRRTITGSGGPPSEQLNLPAGFRFHPTDEELVVNYLLHKSESRPFAIPIIAEVDLYKFDPWELPDKALFGEREWYFFSPRDRKYPNGARPNRAAASGYWKATGTDKPINSRNKKVGVKKALVFYKGKAPKGIKTNWIMHEYRLAESKTPLSSVRKKGSLRLDDWVLCRIYKKSSGAFKVMVSSTAGKTGMKTEPEEELDEVLASLPDIDESGANKFKLPNIGGAPTPVGGAAQRSFFNPSPVFEEMFSPEQDTSTENGSFDHHQQHQQHQHQHQHQQHHHQQQQQQAISFHPSSSLTDTNTTGGTNGYPSYQDTVYLGGGGDNHGSYNSTMVMLNKVNPWAFDNSLAGSYAGADVGKAAGGGGGRIINPPPIKLERVPSNISDILLQIQQQNAVAVSKKRTRPEDEDDVQSTCRSPVPRQTRQGFGFDLTQLQHLNY